MIGELTDISLLRQAVTGCDVVYHLVGSTPARAEADRVGDLRHSVGDSLPLLDMGAAGAFGRIVLVSSGGTVYGTPQTLPIAENAPLWPTCSYGVAKLALERYLHVYRHIYGLSYGIARVSNPFGPFQRQGTGQGVVATLFDCVLTGRPFHITGDGSVVRDFLFVGDLADALTRLGDHQGTEQVFNIGSGIGTELNLLLSLVEEVAERPIERLYGPGRAIDVPINVLDIARSRIELGWIPRVSLVDGLAMTFNWMKERLAG